MSLSKEKLTHAAAEQLRQRKCTRCRNHGFIVPLKFHARLCPFLTCECWKCRLVTERNRITALQRSLKTAHSKRQRAAAGGAHLSTDGAQSAATGARSPLDLRCAAAAGGPRLSGDVLPSSEKRSNDAPRFGELRQPVRLPLIHFPFRMMEHYPSSYVPRPNFMINVPWLPPVSAGLGGTPTFPEVPQSALHHPPPPEPAPPEVYRQVFYTLQPSPLPQEFQEEWKQRQHPQPPPAEPDIVEVD